MSKVLYMVLPCFNEGEVLPETSKQLKEKVEDLIAKNKISKKSKIMFVDDGSKDNTPQILKKYSDSKKINFIQGENKGFIKSFLELLTYCDNAEYFVCRCKIIKK